MQIGIGATLLGLLWVGHGVSRRYVAERTAVPEAPEVVLLGRPAWMNDALAARIIDSVKPGTRGRSALDADLLKEVAHVLAAEPWVKQVRRVRRQFGGDDRPAGVLEIDVEFRIPTALVESDGAFWMVDAEGVKLPERFNADEVGRVSLTAEKSLQLRMITGVAQRAPAAGDVWRGDDLRAGLDLAKLLYDKPFAQDIALIDVSNFSARQNPDAAQIVLHTRHNTEIRWGRPIHARDFYVEVEPVKKLEYLARIHERFGRVDANYPWIDVRFDRVIYPAEAESRQASTRE
jgi:hypothetical protein